MVIFLFYKRKNNRAKASLWLSAVNPPFNMDEPDIVALDEKILNQSFESEISSEFIEEEEIIKNKEI